MGRRMKLLGVAAIFGLVSLMVPPVLPPASGQVKVKRVVVLDFTDLTGMQGRMLGRRAADALANELVRTGEYQVVPREQTDQALRDMHLTLPLSKGDQARLARVLGAVGVFTGVVASCEKVSERPLRVMVRLGVRYLDAAAEEYTSGAAVEATSSPKFGYKGDIDPVIDEALNKAAYYAVQQILRYQAPRAQILTVDRWGEVTINKGREAGIEEGMRMAVLHRVWVPEKEAVELRKVGVIEVTEVRRYDAVGRIVEGNADSMDFVVGIYELPTYVRGVPVRPGVRRARGERIRNTLIAALVLLGLISLATGKKYESAPPRPTAYASSTEAGTVVVRWPRESFPNPANTVAYLIYRGTSPNFQASNLTLIDVVRGTVTEYYDRPLEYDGTVSIEVEEDTGEVTWEEEYEFPEGRKTRQETQYEFEYTHTPPTPGVQYWYRIVRVAKERLITFGPTTTGGGGIGGIGGGIGGIGGGIFRGKKRQGAAGEEVRWKLTMSKPSPPIGPVTPLERPELVNPPNRPNPGWQDVDTRNARFQWYSVAGADQYIIQVSDSPEFPPARTWQSPIVYGTGAQAGMLMEYMADISSKFPMTREWRLFWRVGARNSRDIHPPKGLRSQDDGWVWSLVWEFGTVEMPPGPA